MTLSTIQTTVWQLRNGTERASARIYSTPVGHRLLVRVANRVLLACRAGTNCTVDRLVALARTAKRDLETLGWNADEEALPRCIECGVELGDGHRKYCSRECARNGIPRRRRERATASAAARAGSPKAFTPR